MALGIGSAVIISNYTGEVGSNLSNNDDFGEDFSNSPGGQNAPDWDPSGGRGPSGSDWLKVIIGGGVGVSLANQCGRNQE